MWRSADGLTWERRGEPFGSGRVEALTMFGDTAVAVGTISEPSPVAAVWISPDGGGSWERAGAGTPAFAASGATQMYGVTAGGPGLVAVGLGFDGRTIDAHAWYSSDGRTWRLAAEPLAWSGPGDELLTVACPLPGGGVVVLGSTTLRGDRDVWAWSSQDGITWEQATGPEGAGFGGPGVQSAPACVAIPTGVVVAGGVPGNGGGDGVLWTTADGRSWRTLADPTAFGGPADELLRAVDADGDRLVVAGLAGDDVSVYESADGGATWKRWTATAFGGVDAQLARDVVMIGDRVVIAGIDGPTAAVWIGPAP